MNGPLSTLLAALAILSACGAPQEKPADPKAMMMADELPKEEAPSGSIHRAALDEILRAGPSWLLQRVPIEEVMARGKFIGWRVQRFPAQWEHVDLRPGDIVRSVNGITLETPDRFWTAWTSLAVASEFSIGFERDGQKRELRIPIWGEANPEAAEAIKKPPRRKAQQAPQKRETIIIRPPRRPESGSQHKW
jgi:hypothetical protein